MVSLVLLSLQVVGLEDHLPVGVVRHRTCQEGLDQTLRVVGVCSQLVIRERVADSSEDAGFRNNIHVELEVEHEGRVVHAHVVVLVDPVLHVVNCVQDQDEQEQSAQGYAADECKSITCHV